MAWTYDATLSTDKDKVRYLVGDTNTDDQMIQDEEILGMILDNPNIYRAAAAVCRAVGARLSRELTLVGTAGSIALDAHQQAQSFFDLAAKYDAQAATNGGAGVFAGGISRSDKKTRALNPDRFRPAFTVNLHRIRRQYTTPLDDRTDET